MEQLSSIRPLGERVVVKRQKAEEKKFGTIIIPQNAADNDPSFIAEVYAVGSGRVLESGQIVTPGVRPGDKVLIGKYSGTEIEIDGVKYLTVRTDDLLGVIEDGAS